MNASDPRAARLETSVPRALKLMGSGRPAGALESSESASSLRIGPPDEKDRRDIASQLRASHGAASPEIAGQSTDDEADAIAADIIGRANALLAALRNGAALGSISDVDATAFEAVLQVRGRPALRVEGRLEPVDDEKHPGSGFWRPIFTQHEMELAQIASATGAVVVRDKGVNRQWVQGTAWLIAPDLVVTNRHVLFPRAPGIILAARKSGSSTTARIKTNLDVRIDFAHDNGPARSIVYSIEDIPFVSDDTDPVDIALIRVKPSVSVGSLAPSPLALAQQAPSSGYIYVVGHPGTVEKVPEKVMAVFGSPDERKRVSFGEILQGATQMNGEILHDASTIGGYSGGCVLTFGNPQVMALHYYGHPLSGNRAFRAETLRAHTVANFL